MKRYYWIIYIAIILLIVLALIVFPSIPDMLQMILYAAAIIITSVFLYSTRRRQ